MSLSVSQELNDILTDTLHGQGPSQGRSQSPLVAGEGQPEEDPYKEPITLLQYVVRQMRKDSKDGSGLHVQLGKELASVGAAGSVSLAQLEVEMQELKQGLSDLTNEIKLLKTSVGESDDDNDESGGSGGSDSGDDAKGDTDSAGTGADVSKDASVKKKAGGGPSLNLTAEQKESATAFLREIGPFYKTFEKTFENLQKKKAKVEKSLTELIAHYSEDPKKLPSDEFFHIFSTFVSTVEHTAKEMDEKEEQRQKAEERRLKEAERQQHVHVRSQSFTGANTLRHSQSPLALHATAAATSTAVFTGASAGVDVGGSGTSPIPTTPELHSGAHTIHVAGHAGDAESSSASSSSSSSASDSSSSSTSSSSSNSDSSS